MINSRKKIALLTLFYEPYWSGAEKMVKEIAEGLDDKYDISIITCRINQTFPAVEKKNGYTIVRVGNGISLKCKLFYMFLALREIRRIKPDIIHAIMESYAGGALWLAKYFYPRAKRILTLQSGDLDEERKQKQLLIRLFWKLIHTAPDMLTAISGYLARRVERLGIRKDVEITPNGVDFSALPADTAKIPGRIACVGRLSWEKGHKYLLEAWPQVLARFPQARLVLVGDGSERENIKKQIAGLGIRDSVELTGNLPHNKALTEIACSEIFVCPSLAEGLGIVFIEAQATGVPVIGTDVGGIPDVIEDGLTGLLIAPKDPAAIAAAINKLLGDKEMAVTLAANGEKSAKRFEWRNIISRFETIYGKLLE